MPGITPKVLDFAERVVDAGFSAVLPHLFGVPGKDTSPTLRAVGMVVTAMVPTCVSKEFVVFATGQTSPVVDWLRALAAAEHERCGGAGVGAVGMCFTGGYALAMATEPALLAPVLSQPSLPIGKKGAYGIDISREDLEVVKGRCANEDLRVLGLRFTSDRYVPDTVTSSSTTSWGMPSPASSWRMPTPTRTASPSPTPCSPSTSSTSAGSATHQALDQVLDLFRAKLVTA